jgi:hypothetical protein
VPAPTVLHMTLGFTPRTRADEPSLRVRFFRGREVAELESQINAWLAEQRRREVVDVRQSIVPDGGGGEVLISVWYVDG